MKSRATRGSKEHERQSLREIKQRLAISKESDANAGVADLIERSCGHNLKKQLLNNCRGGKRSAGPKTKHTPFNVAALPKLFVGLLLHIVRENVFTSLIHPHSSFVFCVVCDFPYKIRFDRKWIHVVHGFKLHVSAHIHTQQQRTQNIHDHTHTHTHTKRNRRDLASTCFVSKLNWASIVWESLCCFFERRSTIRRFPQQGA